MPTGHNPPDVSAAPMPRPGDRARETLGPAQRLRRTGQFREAYDQNRSWHGRLMVLFLRSGPDASTRLGVVASRKVGNAVERARAKRRLREAFRRHRGAFAASTDDVVLIARRPILNAPWNRVVDELLKLAGRAGLIPSSRP